MKREIGQSAAVVVIVVVVVGIVGGLIGYYVKPAAPATTVTVTVPGPTVTVTVTAPENKRFSNIHIYFFPGGAVGDTFATVVYNGAVAAAQDLGCHVIYEWSGWDPATMITQFQQAMAASPDGICIMGHPGDNAFDPFIAQAENMGIIVTSANTTLPVAESLYFTKGFGYVGQDLYASGYKLGTAAAKELNLQPGDRAMVWGLLSQPTRGLRTQGIIDALHADNVVVDYIEITSAINSDASLGVPVVTAYIAAHPDVKLIVTDHGSLTATIPTYLSAAGKTPGQIGAAGFDTLGPTIAGIENNWITCVLDQQQWLQGYLPILQVCLTKAYGFSGLYIDTGAGIVDKTNCTAIAALSAEGIR
jgi:simple sugar transport system substrate-binding protein